MNKLDSFFFSLECRLLTHGYEWSIPTVFLYIDIHTTIIDEHDQQSRLRSIYRIFELVDLFLADVVLHSANKFGNQNIKESAINSTSPTNQYHPIILDYTMT
jgi:hypothetical protein